MKDDNIYSIGHGVLIEAHPFGIRANWADEKGTVHSIGLSWPVNPPELVEVIWSRDGKYYYPRGLAKPISGFWLSRTKFETEDEVKEATPAGIFGKTFVRFSDDASEYYRSVLYFNGWDIKSSPDREFISKDDPLIFDYAGLVADNWQTDEAQFNEQIAFTGRNAREIMEKIGGYNAPTISPSNIVDI